jgi:hypothetical protein
MGGKAIDIAERVERDKFFEYVGNIIPMVKEAFDTEVYMVNSYHKKKDFGDLDLLVLADRDFGDRRKIVEKYFSPEQIHINSHILSFNYNELQVDLIFTSPDNWKTSKVFFDWGDLGNLMGKLVNSYGNLNKHGYLLKYGFDGLKCKLVYKGKSKKVYLTKDSKKVFTFLGLNYKYWKKGFNTKEEMFDYVISSKYFDQNIFQWENLTNINKHRNKRRPAYNAFLEYIKGNDKEVNWDKDHNIYLDIIKNTFGVDLKHEMELLVIDTQVTEEIKYKFNGKDIMDMIPSLTGKDLGDNMKSFKDSFTDWKAYALMYDKTRILNDFKDFYEKK